MSYAGDLTPEQAWELLRENPEAVLVDVRTDAEWKYVGIPDVTSLGNSAVQIEWVSYPNGARNDNFVDELKESGVVPGSGKPVIFLCRSGQRSIGAAESATAAGIGPSYNVLDGFEGGLDADGHRGVVGWRAVGLPWRQQ
ncbi:rhodanese-like domain-containing protein [Rhodococcus sp. ACPA4]|uniref:rhodanese-like domain-containing protein n=1 Tax=Rhodococcus TaxID=1827 RepID=UPI000B839A1D|nr:MULTISPECIES: rhodanese-like domain-containing protein [Rhodococcus]PBC44458.1 rhodanese-like domain-containing protein [Rhodococcus sp. ACPA4]ROZ51035.1 rhodanese-like domain-containing protein [Rhodococcus sp. WS3]RZL21606.1 MAG: rhodanese-like domain-containing protein [Rhodococcus sp. (in: high G+C Gram-positive bacteria)]